MYTYISALLILAVVLLGQVVGLHSSLIVSPIFHIVMHIVGGIGIALFVAALINSGFIRTSNRRRTVIYGALIAGIIWEVIEGYYHITGFKLWTAAYYLDTAKDLINDLIGGTLVAWLYWRRSLDA